MLQNVFTIKCPSFLSKNGKILHYKEKSFVTLTTGRYLDLVLSTTENTCCSFQIISLSGGQKSRVAFAILCAYNPNFLILDEPTNHLDIQTIEALGNALLKYKVTSTYVCIVTVHFCVHLFLICVHNTWS